VLCYCYTLCFCMYQSYSAYCILLSITCVCCVLPALY